MANFVTEDDKRIRDATDFGVNDLLETDFFVTDRPGSPSARRQTVQRLINKISALGGKQIASSGITNPDNANGLRGDLYFKVPLDAASLSLYQKGATVWGLIFTIPIGGGGSSSGIPSREVIIDIQAGGAINFLLLDCTGTERPISVLNIVSGETYDFSYTAPNIYGAFPDDTYTLSIIIQGTPADLPEPGPPISGIVSSNPNTFTFTPSDELENDL